MHRDNQEMTMEEKQTVYSPRKMRTGWCVAHKMTVLGASIERYGIKCQTYAEALAKAERMNNDVMNQQEEKTCKKK